MSYYQSVFNLTEFQAENLPVDNATIIVNSDGELEVNLVPFSKITNTSTSSPVFDRVYNNQTGPSGNMMELINYYTLLENISGLNDDFLKTSGENSMTGILSLNNQSITGVKDITSSNSGGFNIRSEVDPIRFYSDGSLVLALSDLSGHLSFKNLGMNNNRITELANGTGPSGAVNLSQLESSITGAIGPISTSLTGIYNYTNQSLTGVYNYTDQSLTGIYNYTNQSLTGVYQAIDSEVSSITGYVDSTFLKLSGGTMSGDINMGSNDVITSDGMFRTARSWSMSVGWASINTHELIIYFNKPFQFTSIFLRAILQSNSTTGLGSTFSLFEGNAYSNSSNFFASRTINDSYISATRTDITSTTGYLTIQAKGFGSNNTSTLFVEIVAGNSSIVPTSYTLTNTGSTAITLPSYSNRNTITNTTLQAIADGSVSARLMRFSASGRSQYTLETEAGSELWRCGLTGGGGVDYSFFDGTDNLLQIYRGGSTIPAKIEIGKNSGSIYGSTLCFRNSSIASGETNNIDFASSSNEEYSTGLYRSGASTYEMYSLKPDNLNMTWTWNIGSSMGSHTELGYLNNYGFFRVGNLTSIDSVEIKFQKNMSSLQINNTLRLVFSNDETNNMITLKKTGVSTREFIFAKTDTTNSSFIWKKNGHAGTSLMTLDNSGNLTVAGTISSGAITASGTYTPTLTGATSLSLISAKYHRIGDIVFVNLSFSFINAPTTSYTFTATMPITGSTYSDYSGVACWSTSAGLSLYTSLTTGTGSTASLAITNDNIGTGTIFWNLSYKVV